MNKQSTKNSLNCSLTSSFQYPNKKNQDISSQTHFQGKNAQKRSQSFMMSNTGYEKLTKQLEGHKKHNSSFNKTFDKKNVDQSSCTFSKKSSNKKKKQKTSLSFTSQPRQSIKGAIRKNRADQRFPCNSHQGHLTSFDSYGTHNFSRKVQNRSLAEKNFSQKPVQRKLKKKTLSQDGVQNQCLQQHMFIKENINPNLRFEEIQKVDDMASKRISQLQSKSQTIDLLKFSIKTKLSKDILNDSSHYFNPLLTTENRSQRQHIEEILKLKDLESNFYIEKITFLQNELNKTRKQRQSIEQEAYNRCNQEHRKNLIEKARFEQENQLLKRENEALRTIILKKINKN